MKDYPYETLLGKPYKRNLFLQKIQNKPNLIKALANHEMFSLLKGNPYSISVMAPLTAGGNTLTEIYHLLKGHNMQE